MLESTLSDSSLNKILDIAPVGESDTPNKRVLVEVPINSITPNTFQPRKEFDLSELESLANSIKQLGVLQPILIRPLSDPDSYELVAGERRWRAAKTAGLSFIPAIVTDLEDIDSLEQAIVENLHRTDLNPIDEAEAYQRLIDDFDLNHSQVASRMGKSRSSITNSIRLLTLPQEILVFVRTSTITSGHAKALLQVDDPRIQVSLTDRIIHEGLSVRSLEDIIRNLSDEPNANTNSSTSKKNIDFGYLEVEQRLSDQLDTTVRVESTKGKGKVVIEFADTLDLARIFDLLKE